MATQTLQVGRLVLREDLTASEEMGSRGERSIQLSGQESIPRLLAVQIQQRREDFLSMAGELVSITFSTKTYLDGFYRIVSASGDIEDWRDNLLVFRWSAEIERIGSTPEIDMESRLSGAITRTNAFSAVGERSHAPSIGALAYWAGSSVPTTVDRPNADGGNIRLFRGIGSTVNPRWGITPAGYRLGRCRLIDHLDRERAGIQMALDATQPWQLHNGVLKIAPGTAGSTFEISVWDTGAWQPVHYLVQSGNPYVTITSWDYLTVILNTFEAITLRATKSFSPSGRMHLDITLRRGSRLTELYLQHEYGTNLKVARQTAAAGTQTSGYITENANDAAGNRYVIASAGSYTADAANGAIEKTATATLDVMIGSVLDGSSALAGDTAAALYAQYLGMPGEVIQGVRR
jgi:hypothetical protein